MTDFAVPQTETSAPSLAAIRRPVLILLTVMVVVIATSLASTFFNLDHEAPLLLDSTIGELADWMADQSEEDAPEALLAQYAKHWAVQNGAESLDVGVLLRTFQNGVAGWNGMIAILAGMGVIGVLLRAKWTRTVLLPALIGLDAMLLIVPTIEGDSTLGTMLLGIVLLLFVLFFAAGKISRVLGFFIVLSALLVVWEAGKSFAQSINYKVTLPQPSWAYDTYPTLNDALAALQVGDITGLVADKNDLEDIMPAYPPDTDTQDNLPYPDLRILTDLERKDSLLFFPIQPEFTGRLSIAVRESDAEGWTQTSQFIGHAVGTVAGEFADERYLSTPRDLVLLDLKILNDLNLPHLQSIAEAFMQPARRNGPFLLVRILADAGLYTWGEALFGFIFGAVLGLVLGTLFAHSPLMERGLLPYVVASQTVPILAIAPMVVIWLGASPTSVSVISAYLTFFPVTINTLRGLQSPNPMQVDLMRSYAASRWTILWKLRFPAALPYIFTALKVSATASVVGAIIGELPSGIGDGLGRAILDFSSDYSLISTPKLWASIVMAATVGIVFFVIVSLIERIVLRGYVRDT